MNKNVDVNKSSYKKGEFIDEGSEGLNDLVEAGHVDVFDFTSKQKSQDEVVVEELAEEKSAKSKKK